MTITYLSVCLRNEIIEEICKDYNFTPPNVYADKIRELADKHMTDGEKKMLKAISEISEVFPVSLAPSEFYLSEIDSYLNGYFIILPERLRKVGEDNLFLLDAKSIGLEAKKTRLDKSTLASVIHSCETVNKFKRSIPQFVKYLDTVIERIGQEVPDETIDTSFLNKYKTE